MLCLKIGKETHSCVPALGIPDFWPESLLLSGQGSHYNRPPTCTGRNCW